MTPQPNWLRPLAPDRAGAAAAEGFHATYGRWPEQVWAAPGRANLIGEHVDYNDGLCLPYALPHLTCVAVRRRTDGIVRITSAAFGETWSAPMTALDPAGLPAWVAYAAGPLWLARSAGADVAVDLLVDSVVPIGAGVASSAALLCAVTCAVQGVTAEATDSDEDPLVRAVALAQRASRAENEFTGVPSGGMDQLASMCGAVDNCVLLDCRDGSVSRIRFEPATAGFAPVIIDTAVSHSNASGEYAQRRRECERAAALLGARSLREIADSACEEVATLTDPGLRARARHVVSEIARVRLAVDALRGGDLLALGPLLDASHASLRDDFQVSTPELELAVAASRQAGALGARLIGAGFGGSVLALVPVQSVDAVGEAVAVAFASAGFAAPQFLPAPPSVGACRLT